MDMLTSSELMPIRTRGKYSFVRNGRTSFPDILSVNRRMRQSWKKNSVMDWYSVSEHLYLLHEFASNGKKPARGYFRYLTKNVDAGKFLRRFDEYLDFMANEALIIGGTKSCLG